MKQRVCQECKRSLIKGAAKKYCSPQCYFITLRDPKFKKCSPQAKNCLVCSKVFKKKKTESLKCFDFRKLCGKKCANLNLRLGKNYEAAQFRAKLKEEILLKDKYTCQQCGIQDRQLMVVDHIIPKCVKPNLLNEFGNLQTLCANCHIKKTNKELHEKYKINFKETSIDNYLRAFEIEYKYKIIQKDLYKLKEFFGKKTTIPPVFVISDDVYFSCVRGDFIRLRLGKNSKELTIKKKTSDKNNITRLEGNLNVSTSSIEDILTFLQGLQAEKLFTITKIVSIFYLDNLIVSVYTVVDLTNGSESHFLEMEINREVVKTKKEAENILYRQEKELSEKFGIGHRNRIKKSLFELKQTGAI